MKIFFGLLAGLIYSGVFAKPPNIIFFLTDDQRWNTLGEMGNPIIQTPEIDALSKQGVTFDNAYATTAICYASRATIFTGQHLSRNGMYAFSSTLSATALPLIYPRILRDSGGYYTGFIGKWGLGDQPASSFNKWWGFPGQGTYEILTNGVVTGHLTPLMGDQALQFLDSAKASNKPFCLQISFKASHIQDGVPPYYIPDPADMGLYVNDSIPSPPLTSPSFFNALPGFLKNPSTELRVRWVNEYSTPALFQQSLKNYYRLISGADKVVGRVRNKLAALSMDTNTVLIFSSDHGYFIGDRGYSGKWLAYQVSSRVPLIIYDPRFSASQKGKHVRDFALNLDIPETILGLAGVKAPVIMQGRNLMGLINCTSNNWRSEFFFEHDYTPAAPSSKAVLTHRYSYIVYFRESPSYEELYDLQNDPDEAVNLIADTRYRAVRDSLRIRFQALQTSVANDNVVQELQTPSGCLTTKVEGAQVHPGKVGSPLRNSFLSGRKTFLSTGGRVYDGSGKRIADPELEKKLFQGD